LVDEETLFDVEHVTFFEGPPEPDTLKPGGLGVNLDLFRQVKAHYKKSKENIACRVLADICSDIRDDGYIGRQDESADRIGTHWSTVQRWRIRFMEHGFLKRHNLKGQYSVDPKVAIRLDEDGKVIEPVAPEKHRFRF
jgi:hypothetical protein